MRFSWRRDSWWYGIRGSGAGLSPGAELSPRRPDGGGQKMFSGTSGATKLSLIVIVGLIVLNACVGTVTGSLSILAQALDSSLDLFAVSVTYLAIRFAA